MNKRTYKKKCEALFKKAKELGIILEFYPQYFDCRRLNCLWYGGDIATIKVSDTFTVELNAYGDVRAFLYDKHGEIIAGVKDKSNCGAFADVMRRYFKTDRQLMKAIRSGKLELDNNNWIEYDGVIKKSAADERGTFIDLGIVCDNILDDDVLAAVEQALDSIEEIKGDICYIAENHYGIAGVCA